MIVDDVVYQTADPSSSLIGNTELTEELQTIYTRLNSSGKELQRVEFIMEDKDRKSVV